MQGTGLKPDPDCGSRHSIGNQERPFPNGACHVQLFPQAALPARTTLRERLHLATHGESLSSRVLAEGVGRRGHFPEGRFSSRSEMLPLRKMIEREQSAALWTHIGLNTLPKAGDGIQGRNSWYRQDQRQRRLAYWFCSCRV
jgi:hypothetical protein